VVVFWLLFIVNYHTGCGAKFFFAHLEALHQFSFEAARLILTVYMLCSAVLLALLASGWLGPFGTMAVLAFTGFAIGIGGRSRDLMI
jgi:hypothetical protein